MSLPLKQEQPMQGLSQNHLTGIAPLSVDDIETILDRAGFYADGLARGDDFTATLKNRVVMTLFFEDSTRTRTSFDIALARLGATGINWDADQSSISKGESFSDTVRYLDAMRPDGIIIRHKEYGAPEFVASHVSCPVINAGDSWREHPTQALLDALTIRRAKGTIEGLNIAICGDIAHSRVANSNMILLSRLGANVRAVAPELFMPEKFPADTIAHFMTLEDGIKDCDIVMMLRLQKERLPEGMSADALDAFQLTPELLRRAAPKAGIMHPGPMNRGSEIADDVADDPHVSLIFEQARMGVPTRMAVLDLLLNGRGA